MTTQPTTEIDLLRVTVIKKKHATQLRERWGSNPATKFEDVDLLYHIDEWDAILCRRKNNQHALAEAREIIENLPQLLLD